MIGPKVWQEVEGIPFAETSELYQDSWRSLLVPTSPLLFTQHPFEGSMTKLNVCHDHLFPRCHVHSLFYVLIFSLACLRPLPDRSCCSSSLSPAVIFALLSQTFINISRWWTF
jgi:hypothetical protein